MTKKGIQSKGNGPSVISKDPDNFKLNFSWKSKTYNADVGLMRVHELDAAGNPIPDVTKEIKLRRVAKKGNAGVKFEAGTGNGRWEALDNSVEKAIAAMYDPFEKFKKTESDTKTKREKYLQILFVAFVACAGIGLHFNPIKDPTVLTGIFAFLTAAILMGREYYAEYWSKHFPVKEDLLEKAGVVRKKNKEQVVHLYAAEAVVTRLGCSDSTFALEGELVRRQVTGWKTEGWSRDIAVELIALFPYDDTCEEAIVKLKEVLATPHQNDGVHFMTWGKSHVSFDDHNGAPSCHIKWHYMARGEEGEINIVVRFGVPTTPPPIYRNYILLLRPKVDVCTVADETLVATLLEGLVRSASSRGNNKKGRSSPSSSSPEDNDWHGGDSKNYMDLCALIDKATLNTATLRSAVSVTFAFHATKMSNLADLLRDRKYSKLEKLLKKVPFRMGKTS